MTPGPDECYHSKVLADQVRWTANLREQSKDLPDGARVELRMTDGRPAPKR